MSARSMRRARTRALERERRRAAATVGIGAGAALGATVLFAPAAEAATFTVTNLNNDGSGSLRQAIVDANNFGGDDTVVFQAGLSGTITLTGADSDIEIYYEGIDIQGPGASQVTVDGNDLDRIFFANGFDNPNEPVRISGLTLRDGYASNPGGNLGGAFYSDNTGGYAPEVTIADAVLTSNTAYDGGGAIWTDYGSLHLTNSTLSNNEALNERGGALYTNDTDGDAGPEVVITGSTFTGNTAPGDGYGGAIDVDGPHSGVLIEASTFSGNTSRFGPGGARLYNIDGDLTVRDSTFSGNESGEVGGGLQFYNAHAVTIEGSTFSNNRADEIGGGVVWFGNEGEFPATIQNSTFSGNSATLGGAVYVFDEYDSEKQIRNSTITSNSATGEGGGIAMFINDDTAPGLDVLGLQSTIVANNTAATGPDLAQPDTPTTEGSFDLGFSLVRDTSDATITENPAGSNLLGVDPLLGPLADNGGPAQTHLPQIGSPALDAGIANGLPTDQRGLARTFDASNLANAAGGDGTDIGATELAAEGTCKGKAATVLFAPGQKIVGSSAKDVVVGTDAKDKVATKGGKDTVCAGKGNDKVNGGGGKDNLNGEKGKDTLKGGGGKDKLSGGPGKDKLRGGPGKDKLSGGGGKDSEVQ